MNVITYKVKLTKNTINAHVYFQVCAILCDKAG